MPKPDVEQCAFVFNKLDTDHSGKLDIDELWESMKKISNPNISREEVQHLQQLMEQDEPDGLMDLKEFTQLVYVCQNADMTDQASMLFYIADEDFSDNIDKDELKRILQKLNITIKDEVIDQMMAGGQLDYANFKKLFS